MDANELFKQSKQQKDRKRNGYYVLKCGLTERTASSLARCRLANRTKDGDFELDYNTLYDAVTTGKIWYCRNIGTKSVMEICEWLAEKAKGGES